MTLGDVAFGQDDVVALDATDRDLVLVEIQPALGTTLFRDDNCEHGLLCRLSGVSRWDANWGSRGAPLPVRAWLGAVLNGAEGVFVKPPARF